MPRRSPERPLSRITRDAIDFVARRYLTKTVVKHPDRSEAERFWNFPRVAIEEAIVNAVYHRSYEEREPVEVRISPEDLVVLSFPGPDRSVRMEDLRAGKAVSRRYRNRRIGEFLKELDLTEGRSTGVPKILRAMRNNGSPEPQFESDEDRTYFLIRLPVHERAERSTPQVTGQVTPHVTPQVTPQVERVVMAIEGGGGHPSCGRGGPRAGRADPSRSRGAAVPGSLSTLGGHILGAGGRGRLGRHRNRGHRLSNQQDRQVLEGDMNVTYDADTDTLTIVLSDAPVAESDEDKPGVIIDYDDQGNLVSIEVLDASARVQDPRSVTLSA